MPNTAIDISTIDRGVYTFRALRDKKVSGEIIKRGQEFELDSTDPLQWDVLHSILVLTRAPSKAFRLISVHSEGAEKPRSASIADAIKADIASVSDVNPNDYDADGIPKVPPVVAAKARTTRAKKSAV